MPKMLTSWKEIAQYFGKGVRTVQRWERAFGLPVRRAEGADHRAVMALAEELDEWVRGSRLSQPSELDTLRLELAVLRAENISLRRELERTTGAVQARNGSWLDDNLPMRSSNLVFVTREARDRALKLRKRSLEIHERAFELQKNTRQLMKRTQQLKRHARRLQENVLQCSSGLAITRAKFTASREPLIARLPAPRSASKSGLVN